MWLTTTDCTHVKVTDMQFDTAQLWAKITRRVEGPSKIIDVFPRRHWSSEIRRSCSQLAKKGVLIGTDEDGYVLEPAIKRKFLRNIAKD